jgi:hypothetical protein
MPIKKLFLLFEYKFGKSMCIRVFNEYSLMIKNMVLK